MTYSQKTLIIYQIILGLIGIVGVLIIRYLYGTEKKKGLTAKLFGYVLLSSFSLTAKDLRLPAGALVAYIIGRRASTNKRAKTLSLILGFILWAIPTSIIMDNIEQKIYPRDDIKTYLSGEREFGGIAMIVHGENGALHAVCTANLFDSDIEMADKLYAELLESQHLDKVNIEEAYSIRFNQDIDDPRFSRLVFGTSEQGDYLQLNYESKTYTFKTTEVFQRMFRGFINEKSAGK